MENKKRILFIVVMLLLLNVSIISEDTLKIMPLGDSITMGKTGGGRKIGDGGYRKRLYPMLKDWGLTFDFVGDMSYGTDFTDGNHFPKGTKFPDRDYQAYPGKKIPWLTDKNRLRDALDDHTPHLVLLHIGTNGSSEWDKKKKQLNAVFDVIDKWNNDNPMETHVVVAVAFIIQRRGWDINTYNFNWDIWDLLWMGEHINKYDNEPWEWGEDYITVDLEEVVASPSEYADNLHPNADGYYSIAENWCSAIIQWVDYYAWWYW